MGEAAEEAAEAEGGVGEEEEGFDAEGDGEGAVEELEGGEGEEVAVSERALASERR